MMCACASTSGPPPRRRDKFIGRKLEQSEWKKHVASSFISFQSVSVSRSAVAGFLYSGTLGVGKSRLAQELCKSFLDESSGVLDPKIVPRERRVCATIDFDSRGDQDTIEMFGLTAEQALIFYTVCGVCGLCPKQIANSINSSSARDIFLAHLRRVLIFDFVEQLGCLLRSRSKRWEKGDSGWSAIVYHFDEMQRFKDSEFAQELVKMCMYSSVCDHGNSLSVKHKVFPVFIFTTTHAATDSDETIRLPFAVHNYEMAWFKLRHLEDKSGGGKLEQGYCGK
jgi:hypothetical protein